MSTMEAALSQPFFRALGWSLVHFLWQGALVAALYACVRLALRGAAPHLRYAAACSAMLLMLAFPVATLYVVSSSGEGAAAKTQAGRGDPRASEPRQKLASTKLSSAAGQGDADPSEVLPPEAARARDRAGDSFGPLLAWLAALWLAGALALTTRFLIGWGRAQKLSRGHTLPAGRDWQATLALLSRRMRVSRPVRLCQSALVEVPAVVGWLRPVILVPAGVLAGLTPGQVEALLAHELAHVRRHDYLVNLFQTAAETLLFYHPAVWWVSREIRAEREHCCDDAAVEACGDVLAYARALTSLEQMRVTSAAPIALAASGGPLLARIRRLVESPGQSAAHHSPWFAGFVIALAALALFAGARGTLLYGGAAAGVEPAPLTYSKAGRRVAVTFYSLPYLRHYTDGAPSAEENTAKLLKSLTSNNITAVGFVGGRSLYKGGTEPRTSALRMWLDAGMELGTQTYSHRWLYETPLEDYKADVVRGEAVTRPLMKERGRALRYFLYPFLNTGADLDTKAAVEKFLGERGLQFAPVTVDNADWIFAKAYDEATGRGDLETARRVSDEYVPYMESMFEFYERLSADVCGYEVPQILMLGANRLNADRLPDLIAMMRRRGYSFVTLEEAMKDGAYAQPDNFTGPVGVSWLQRWAVTKGMGFRKEPPLPPFMRQFDPKAASASDFKSN